MAGGVKLATGYITIEAETSKVPTQIKEALNKAGTDAAKPAGQQMGKDIAQGINEGMRSVPSGGGSNNSVISDVIQGKPVSGNVRAQGAKVGKELSTGIQQGIDQGWGAGGAGGGLGKSIQQSIDAKKTGTQIGKDVGTSVQKGIDESMKGGERPIDIIKGAAKDFGKEVAADLKAGEVDKAFGRVGDVAENATTMVNNLGHAVGVNLDGVEKFGVDVAKALDTAGDYGQKIYDSVTKAGTALAAFKSGDAAGGISALSGLARDWDQSGLAGNLDKLDDFVAKFAETRDQLKGATDQLAEFAALAGARGAGAAGWLSRFAGAAGPTAAVYLGMETFAPKWKDPWLNMMDPNKPLAPSDLLRMSTPFIGVPEAVRQQYFPGSPSIIPARLPWERPKTVEELQAEGKLPTPPPSPEQVAATSQELLGGGGRLPPVAPKPGEDIAATLSRTLQEKPPPATAPVVSVQQVAAPGAAQIGHATEAIQTASISVGSASISGVSAPSTSPAPAAGGPSPSSASKPRSWMDMMPHKEGGPILDDEQNAQLHKGELVVPADVVKDAGGPEAIKGQLTQALAPPTGGIDGAGGTNVADAIDAARTAGFIPTGAGSKSVAGTSFVAGLLNLGNEAVGGLIDTGAAAAQTALSMAASAGSFGAGGQAAGALGGIGIQLAASEGKRAASYGFQMASILADSVIDQVFGPFGGPPRWLGYDYTQFVPHINIGAIGTTTVEKAMQAAQGKPGGPGQQPGGPVVPEHLGGEQPVGPPVPKFGQPAAPQSLGGAGPQGQPAPPGGEPPPPPDTGPPPPGPPPESVAAPGALPGPGPSTGFDLHNLLGFDEGGWLMPNTPALNTTGRPELVLSPQQLESMQTSGNGNPWRGGDTFHITTIDAEGVGREIDKRKRLSMMQYGGRP
jgi:hypothetical protein